jgi:hypothetical protein
LKSGWFVIVWLIIVTFQFGLKVRLFFRQSQVL